MNWISVEDQLPPENTRIIAKNPFIESESWIDGLNELGKPRWFHEDWEHADNYVTHWRFKQ